MNAEATYLDSSALVKLVVREAESEALAEHLRRRSGRISCALARVEVVRAVRGHGSPALARATNLLERISIIRLDDALLNAAAVLDAENLRSLDAIHLAAAQALAGDLAELVTYDQRMAVAARHLQLPTVAPA